MSRGRRYNHEPKLNIKKVIAVAVAIIVIIMFVVALKNLLNSDSSSNNLVSTTYFVINEDNKWGVIDNNAQIIIEPTYDETIIIPNNKRDVFICTYDANYEDGTYKTKVIDNEGKELFKEYDKVQALENYDENKNMWYENNVLLVEKDGKYGLINLDGDKILDTVYENIYTLKEVKNSLITVKEAKLGLVDNLGKEVIKNKYEEIKSLGKDTKNYIVKENGKYGVYGILNCKYQEIKALNNNEIFCVKENNKYKVINKEEKVVFTEKFDNIETIQDNIIVYKNSKGYTAYNVNTKQKLSKTYTELTHTSNNMFIVKVKSNYGIINMENETEVKTEYSNINYYEDVEIYELEEKDADVNTILDSNLKEITKGIVNNTNSEKSYIRVWTEDGYKYYKTTGEEKKSSEILTQNNLFLSKQNNKYGFIDKEGNVVVDYIYDDAKEQNEFGYAAVKKDGLWGCLDKKGNYICNTKYNLDENLLVDFVGEYHVGVDTNLMYYTR